LILHRGKKVLSWHVLRLSLSAAIGDFANPVGAIHTEFANSMSQVVPFPPPWSPLEIRPTSLLCINARWRECALSSALESEVKAGCAKTHAELRAYVR
jgi:hypothetical protein